MLWAVNLASNSKSLLRYEQEGSGYGESGWRSQASGGRSCRSSTARAGSLAPNPAGTPVPMGNAEGVLATRHGLSSRNSGLTLRVCLGSRFLSPVSEMFSAWDKPVA